MHSSVIGSFSNPKHKGCALKARKLLVHLLLTASAPRCGCPASGFSPDIAVWYGNPARGPHCAATVSKHCNYLIASVMIQENSCPVARSSYNSSQLSVYSQSAHRATVPT